MTRGAAPPGAERASLPLTFLPDDDAAGAMHCTSTQVRGRLAPSPTGQIHLGNAWSFLLAWLAARSARGAVVLRMEDIDPERSRPQWAEGLRGDLLWLGLDWDEEPWRQGDRFEAYAGAIEVLKRAGRIYPCFCSRKELRGLASAPHALVAEDGSTVYPGTCRELTPQQRAEFLRQGRRPALRLRCDDISVSFDDLVAGPQKLRLLECGGDFAVRRSDGVFAYQLAVVVDDLAQGITQVVRGADILSSTPRQVFLYSLLGGQPPQHAHLPLLLDAHGERLAKRHQSLTVASLRDCGVPASAITGYLGWRAGLLPSPQPCSPNALLPLFSFSSLPSGPVALPPDITDVLLALR